MKTYSHVLDGSEALVLQELAATHNELLYVCMDDVRMEQTRACLEYFAPELETICFPAWDCIPYDRVSPNNVIVNQRMQALTRLANGRGEKPRVVVTTVNALIQKVVPKAVITQASFAAHVGEDMDRDYLQLFLVENGYIHMANATEPGEFAVRGSIIDIIPAGAETGYRLDFFGDMIESIREFDPLTQISTKKIEFLELVPASEVLLSPQTVEEFRYRYRDLFGAVMTDDPLYEAVSESRKYAGMEHWLPLFYKELDSLTDYLNAPQVVLSHLAENAWTERRHFIEDAYASRKETLHAKDMAQAYHPVPVKLLYLEEMPYKDDAIRFEPYDAPDADKAMPFATVPDFMSLSKQQNQTPMAAFAAYLKAESNPTLITCGSEGAAERIRRMVGEYDLQASMLLYPHPNLLPEGEGSRSTSPSGRGQNTASILGEGQITLTVLPLESGFKTPDFTVISEADLLGERIGRKVRRKRKDADFISELASLEAGELIVHKEHGIGRYEGLETMTVRGETHDFIFLTYADGDKFYLPVENIDLISRHGGDADETPLDKLGGASWQKRAAAVKKRLKVTAKELMEVAAKRAVNQADIYDAPAGLYDEFCNRFPYTETDDQLHAIEDVLEDLRSGQPMDRLVCGDVGFGKTEVALRAAFVVACPAEGQPKGQVALIAPTTLLARQHVLTFRQRFKDLGITIKELSRMVPAKELKATKEGIADGSVDIVIGTHALLSKDVSFHHLGMMIVDEEQRFGVKQKERLKKLRANTHVLTLTATPIPRTLQLSLAGVRDLSLITTPPVDRLAVRTFVMPTDQVILREAILREHYRGGQTFYVAPRIKDVEELEPKLKELVPEVKIIAAHGQMNPDRLDEIMTHFSEGKFDVLLCTTIIESGIDIPAANTLIAHRADQYGLAQLYQIRGRVGRSKVRAFAYLTLPPRKVPTKQARKRLDVMQKLDNLGAGFMLASHDMDIRGFGNLVGDEQSGQVKEVGIELYQSMLKEAIEQMQALKDETEVEEERISPKLSLGISALLPESYIADLSLRMGLYRRLGGIESEAGMEEVAVELVDRFGPLPDEVENLLELMKLRILCVQAGIIKLDASEKGAAIQFYQDQFGAPQQLFDHIMRHPHELKLDGEKKTLIIKNQSWGDAATRFKGLRHYVSRLGAMLAENEEQKAA